MTPGSADVYTAHAKMASGKIGSGRTGEGELLVTAAARHGSAKTQREIDRYMSEYGQLAAQKRNIRTLYLLFILAIALFILFVATWIALLLARQISSPISALLDCRWRSAPRQLESSREDSSHRRVGHAGPRLQRNDAGARSQQPRARKPPPFYGSDPRKHPDRSDFPQLRRPYPARESRLAWTVPVEQVLQAVHLARSFPPEDTSEIQYLMKRARRTGVAASQIDIPSPGQVMHLAVTVSALPAQSRR